MLQRADVRDKPSPEAPDIDAAPRPAKVIRFPKKIRRHAHVPRGAKAWRRIKNEHAERCKSMHSKYYQRNWQRALWRDPRVNRADSGTLLAVGLEISRAATFFGADCYPPMPEIARLVGVSLQTVYKRVRQLEDMGYLRAQVKSPRKQVILWALTLPLDVGDREGPDPTDAERRREEKAHLPTISAPGPKS